MSTVDRWPPQGCGAGLRPKHYSAILSESPKVDWFEAVSENYLDTGGRPIRVLEEVRKKYPVALHGVALNVGSADPLDKEYLRKLKALADRVQPFSVSDHLCWTGVDGEGLHDLLPLPYTEEALKHVARRVDEVQEFLGRPILLENISSYISYRHSQVPEWELLREIARRTGCGLLLDINNIYVNASNHRFDAYRYLDAIPPSMVGQFHLAGHADMGGYLFDTHGAEVVPGVWKLYERALRLFGRVSTLVEWDENIPDFEGLMKEVDRARSMYERARRERPKEAPAVPLYMPAAPAQGPGLQQLQREFKTRVKDRQDKKLEPVLNAQGGVPGIQRMEVYADGHVSKLAEALGEIYEAVRHLIGKEAFHELTAIYLERHPAQGYNLNDAGRELPELVAQTRFAEKLPFLADLARLEWAVSRAFHAFDEPAFDPAVLADYSEEDWEKMRVRFQPSVAAVSSAWPVLDIWRSRHTPLAELDLEVENRPQSVLVFRKELEVFCEPIDRAQYELVRSLLGGQALGGICSRIAEESQAEDLPLERWFSEWTGQGLIAEVANA